MAKLKIKNFGPIKEGVVDGDGYIDTKKVTVFIGNQGSGKSTVAKLISTFSWLEKAFVKENEEITEDLSLETLSEYLNYQNISQYFILDKTGNVITEFDYQGEKVNITLKDNKVSLEENKSTEYNMPKIMYVPSDRNFISAVENFRELKGLSTMMYLFAAEFDKALKDSVDSLQLPIGNVQFHYESTSRTSFIGEGEKYKIKLSEASSGYQSLVPLYIVSSYLTRLVKLERDENRMLLSGGIHKYLSLSEEEVAMIKYKESIKLEKEEIISKMEKLVKESENNLRKTPKERLSVINSNYKNIIRYSQRLDEIWKIEMDFFKNKNLNILKPYLYHSFLNIVEEPEQNLYPSSQRIMLNSLLALNNELDENRLVITTHSPYLINYLTLAVKGKMVLDTIGDNQEKRERFHKIVPEESVINGEELVIYQLDEKEGTIRKLDTYKGMPSDENWLNEQLGEFNDDYATLLEIEKF
ncbi:AAA family ATPase [Myroides odoratimimus]|uniref:AAA family ATPase n=1 Tax=Myroides odoratimimus TaxID=76832 RepID=UPI0025781304|nr:AAA family ATPase [Myroides odoratimimus]MDM1395589.1 AAA family ATPase [Myroides odoratimimus]